MRAARCAVLLCAAAADGEAAGAAAACRLQDPAACRLPDPSWDETRRAAAEVEDWCATSASPKFSRTAIGLAEDLKTIVGTQSEFSKKNFECHKKPCQTI